MKSLKKLQKKLLLKNYGFLATAFLKLVAPMGASTVTLETWHPFLIKIRDFSDLYLKLIIYFLILCGMSYAVITYLLTLISLDEILLVVSNLVRQS